MTEKTQVDITTVPRDQLEQVVLRLQSENRLQAQQIISLNRLNRNLEGELANLGERMLIVRGLLKRIEHATGLQPVAVQLEVSDVESDSVSGA